MHFRERGGSVQLVRTTYDPDTKKPKQEIVGRMRRAKMEVTNDLAAQLTDEEKGELTSYIERVGNLDLLSRKLEAHTLLRTVNSAIDYARDYAVQRQQFGQPISKFQIIQHKFADMRIMYQTARAMTYRVAAMIDAGLEPVEDTAIAKIVASENDFKCADLGLQIMGGAGYTMAHDMQRLFRDSRLASIGGGTNDIHRNTIAKLMGL